MPKGVLGQSSTMFKMPSWSSSTGHPRLLTVTPNVEPGHMSMRSTTPSRSESFQLKLRVLEKANTNETSWVLGTSYLMVRSRTSRLTSMPLPALRPRKKSMPMSTPNMRSASLGRCRRTPGVNLAGSFKMLPGWLIL